MDICRYIISRIPLWALAGAMAVLSIVASASSASFVWTGSAGFDQIDTDNIGAIIVVAFWPAIVATLDLSKYAITSALSGGEHHFHRIRRRLLVAVVVALSIVSITAAAFLVLEVHEANKAPAAAETQRLEELRAQRENLETELKTYGNPPTPAVIKSQLAALRHDRRWETSSGCTDATAPLSRRLCKEDARLFGALAGATRADELRSKIAALSDRIRAATTSETTQERMAGLARLEALLEAPEGVLGLIVVVAVTSLYEVASLVIWGLATSPGHRLTSSDDGETEGGPDDEAEKDVKTVEPDADDYSDLHDPDDGLPPAPPLTVHSDSTVVSFERSVKPTSAPSAGTFPTSCSVGVGSLPDRTAHGTREVLGAGLPKLQAVQGLVTTPQPAQHALQPSADDVSIVGDPIAFWDACITPCRDGDVGATELYRSYVAWCAAHGYRALAQSSFAKRVIAAKQPDRKRAASGNVYRGIRVAA
jgi:hypothetical protein